MQPGSRKNATDLITSSKQKFTLSQSRLRRGLCELALLSLQGSLEDGLRSYLLLHHHPAARGDVPTLLAALGAYPPRPLAHADARQVRRMALLWQRVAQGEAATLTSESLIDYQQQVASLLQRYGILVVPTSSAPATADQRTSPPIPPDEQRIPWRRMLQQAAILATLLLLLLLVGAAASLAVSQVLAQQRGEPGPLDTIELLAPATPLQPAPPTAPRLAPGQTVIVRADLGHDLALLTRPGSAEGNPPRFYLSPGTAVHVTDGPIIINGSDWWQVSAINQRGWCQGRDLAQP